MSALLEIDGLSLAIPSPGGARPLLRDVTLSIGAGETVGLVGESGSGKSLTARSVVGLMPEGGLLGGDIRIDGTSLTGLSESERQRVRSTELAMVFQDPRAHVNPVRRIGDHLTEALRLVQHVSASEARSRALDLLRAVKFEDPERLLDLYPHQLSGGMLQRIMIAGALTTEPRILLADEPTTALDVTTQAQVIAILAELKRTRGMSILFITHDLELAASTCDRTVVMYAGSVMEEQPSMNLQRRPRHPYSSALLQSRPSMSERQDRLPTIPGRPISAADVAEGCPFATRCTYAEPRCSTTPVPLQTHSFGAVACLRVDELTLPGTEVPA